MIDLPIPIFKGNTEEKIKQLTKYTQEFYDTISRKFENIDITDCNYTLAEMIRRKPMGDEEQQGEGENVFRNIVKYYALRTAPAEETSELYNTIVTVGETTVHIGCSVVMHQLCQGNYLITWGKFENVPMSPSGTYSTTNVFTGLLPYPYKTPPAVIISNENLALYPGVATEDNIIASAVYLPANDSAAASVLQDKLLLPYWQEKIESGRISTLDFCNSISIFRGADAQTTGLYSNVDVNVFAMGEIADGVVFRGTAS